MSADGPWTVFRIFLRLGLTSFGGPVAHLGYFRSEFVTRRGWLGERAYADLVALCQFLPGPASSQVGMALGLTRAGYAGALAAWAGFTLPSALLMILFAQGLSHAAPLGALHGLKVAAVAVVAQAVWGMARTLCADGRRVGIMVAAACGTLAVPSAWGQVGVILAAAGAGLVLLGTPAACPTDPVAVPVGRRTGALWLAVFLILLAGLPLLAHVLPNHGVAMIDAFFRAGSLVFGGGHVVLPLLRAEVVPLGWVGDDRFLAGYGAAQALPGPLLTFAAFLGASMTTPPGGWVGGVICLLAVFAPSFLLVAGALPFWQALRGNRRAQAGLAGINAAVVGLLLAALYHPVWTGGVTGPPDFALAVVALAALTVWRLPPWLVVAGCGCAGWLGSYTFA